MKVDMRIKSYNIRLNKKWFIIEQNLYMSLKYMKYISNIWEMDKNNCKLVLDLDPDEKYYTCKDLRDH